jgi:hypothetical protein
VALEIGTKLIMFEPVTPSAGAVVSIDPAVPYVKIESALAPVEAPANSPRATTAVRSPVHPSVMRIISS